MFAPQKAIHTKDLNLTNGNPSMQRQLSRLLFH